MTVETNDLAKCANCKVFPINRSALCAYCRAAKRRGNLDGFLPRPLREKKACQLDGCEVPARSKGWCHRHYIHFSRYSPEDAGFDPSKCLRVKCYEPRYNSGLCEHHYGIQRDRWNESRRLKRQGKELPRLAKQNKPAKPIPLKKEKVKRDVPDDLWTFVQQELGMKK
ncbi:MAG: hypothetical protein ACKOQ8_05595 [Micrococcales bacterium]